MNAFLRWDKSTKGPESSWSWMHLRLTMRTLWKTKRKKLLVVLGQCDFEPSILRGDC